MANLMSNAPKKTAEQIEKEQILAKKLAQLSERTRLLEERLKHLHQKLQVIDETNSKKVNDLRDKIKHFDEQLSTTRKEFDEIKEIVRRIVKDIGQTAKLSDVRVLEKYINMVDITRLVTKEDVIRIITEREQENKLKKKKK